MGKFLNRRVKQLMKERERALKIQELKSKIPTERPTIPKGTSKRMAKKLAATGRTTTTQKIKPPVIKTGIKVTAPRPTLPNNWDNAPLQNDKEELAKGKEEFRRFLLNMIGGTDDPKYRDCMDDIEQAILNASHDQLDKILEVAFGGSSKKIRDFYLYFVRNPKMRKGRKNSKFRRSMDKAQAKTRLVNFRKSMDTMISILGVKCGGK